LERLRDEKGVNGTGIELSESGVSICRQKGLSVSAGRIDEPLPFADHEFDFAICNVTIQMVLYPEILLSEMKRIAKYQIVSFPNFGFVKNRVEMLFRGRMPKHMLFGYHWYSTGHIHQLSMTDFYELVGKIGGLRIVKNECRDTENTFKKALRKLFPNLFQILPVFLLTSELEQTRAE
jgi:methionine biosynthesis protein MetW